MTASDPAARLLTHVQALLSDQGVDTEWGDDGLLEVVGEPALGPCVGYLGVTPVATGAALDADERFLLLQAVWPLPFAAPDPKRRLATAALLAEVAPDLALGQFEFDPDTGGLRFRVTLLLPAEIQPSDGWLLAPLLEGLNLLDAYAPLFGRVLEAGEAAGHAYVAHRVAEAQADGVALDPLDRERCLRALEAAASDYRKAGDATRLAALSPLVRQLSAG